MKKNSLLFFICILFATRVVGQSINEGVYVIRLASNPSFVIDLDHAKAKNGQNILLWSFSGSVNQKWRVTHSNGAIVLTSMVNNAYALDIYGGRAYDGCNIACFGKHGNNNQRWFAIPSGLGYILISALDRNYALSLAQSAAKNGQNIVLKNGNGLVWKFERVDQGTSNTMRDTRPANRQANTSATNNALGFEEITDRYFYADCLDCNKTGRCSWCNRTGRDLILASMGTYVPCGVCAGTTICKICSGQKRVLVDKYAYPAGGSTSSSSSSSSSTTQRRECRRCIGTGQIPFSITQYKNIKNSTFCNGYGHSGPCDVVSCQVCKQNHCKYMSHLTCESCNGRGYK